MSRKIERGEKMMNETTKIGRCNKPRKVSNDQRYKTKTVSNKEMIS